MSVLWTQGRGGADAGERGEEVTTFVPSVKSVARPEERNASQLQHVAEAVHGMMYGEIRVVVCSGNIVEVDATHKKRFTPHKD